MAKVENFTLKNLTDLNSNEGLGALVLFKEYPDALLNFGAISCIIFMIVGIPGNLITVFALARCKKVRNATAIFIINMSCADLLFACINLPLAASTFWTRRWEHGFFMCQFFVFARFSLSGVAVFTILAITINRYIMISHYELYTKLYTSRKLAIQVVCIWMGAFLSLAPTWAEAWGRFGMDEESSFCVILEVNGRSPRVTMFVCAFVIPFIAICYCYGRIFFIARKTTAKSRGIVRKAKTDKEESSFPSSTAERSPNSEQERAVQLLNPPEHPRVQSLRPLANKEVTMASEPSSSTSRVSNFNLAKSVKLRKSQILNIAPTSKDKRLLTMISAIMISFFVFHLPITIIKVSHEITNFNPQLIIWSYLLRYLTACINPIIYVVMSNEYRKAYKKVMVIPTCENKLCLPR